MGGGGEGGACETPRPRDPQHCVEPAGAIAEQSDSPCDSPCEAGSREGGGGVGRALGRACVSWMGRTGGRVHTKDLWSARHRASTAQHVLPQEGKFCPLRDSIRRRWRTWREEKSFEHRLNRLSPTVVRRPRDDVSTYTCDLQSCIECIIPVCTHRPIGVFRCIDSIVTAGVNRTGLSFGIRSNRTLPVLPDW